MELVDPHDSSFVDDLAPALVGTGSLLVRDRPLGVARLETDILHSRFASVASNMWTKKGKHGGVVHQNAEEQPDINAAVGAPDTEPGVAFA